VAAVILAIASSVMLGVSSGALAATRSHASLRPCRLLLEHRWLTRWSCACVALTAAIVAVLASIQVDYERAELVLTCSVVASLAGFVVWLLLVEGDDDPPAEPPDEPEWWPTFERELEEWSKTRIPVAR
jgi:general stress protein CsbA